METQPEVEELIGAQTEEVQAIARRVQSIVRGLGLELTEDASLKLKNIYWRHGRVICAVAVHKAHANLHFYRGVELSDPDGVLEGGGGMLRHFKFRRADEVDADQVARYVREAYALDK